MKRFNSTVCKNKNLFFCSIKTSQSEKEGKKKEREDVPVMFIVS